MVILQQPDALTFSHNIMDVRIENNTAIDVVIYKNGVQKVVEKYYPNSANKITIKLKDFVKNQLSAQLPSNLALPLYHQSGAYASFSISLNNNEQVINFVAITGGLNVANQQNYLTQNFLTLQNQVKEIQENEIQFLTFYANQANLKVKIKAYFNDATNQEIEYQTLVQGQLNLINTSFNVIKNSFNKTIKCYDVSIVAGTTVLGYVQRYILNYTHFFNRNLFIFENSQGGLDTIAMDGQLKIKPSLETKTALFDETIKDYYNNPEIVYSKNTGYIKTPANKIWHTDFLNSKNKWFLKDGVFVAIVVQKVSAEIQKGFLNDFDFDFITAEKQLNLTPNRMVLQNFV